MSDPCALCAHKGTSCCQKYQVVLTNDDTLRIASYTGNWDFLSIEYPVCEDIEPDYDPLWLPMILMPDRHVKVVKRASDKKCILLSKTGCVLPIDKRPLICRLYPYIYIEQGILGIDSACPISQYKNWESVLSGMEMPKGKAAEWISMLYSEIRF